MKKKILTLLILSNLVSMSCFSQNSSIIIGIDGGTSFHKQKLSGDYSTEGEEAKNLLRFNGGINLGFRYANFSLISGVKFIQRGGKTFQEKTEPTDPFYFTDGTADVGTYKTKTTMNSIGIPIILRYEFPMESMSFALSMGPVINKQLGKAIFTDEFDLTTKKIDPSEIKLEYGTKGNDVYRPNFTSFVINAGVLFNIGDNGKFKVNMNYETSGNTANENLLISDEVGNISKISGSIKTSGLGLSLGYEHRINLTMGSKY